MSNDKNQARVATSQTGQSEIERLRDDVASLRQAVADLAYVAIPDNLRRVCPHGKLAVRIVHGVHASTEARAFPQCGDDCHLPDGWRAAGALELGPGPRETVRIANALGVKRPPSE
jgi:hypothetical protein